MVAVFSKWQPGSDFCRHCKTASQMMPWIVWLSCLSNVAKSDLASHIPSDAVLFFEFKVQDLMADLAALEQPEDVASALEPSILETPALRLHKVLKDTRRRYGKTVVALAVIDIGVVYGGLCTQLDCQERALLAFMCDPHQRVGTL